MFQTSLTRVKEGKDTQMPAVALCPWQDSRPLSVLLEGRTVKLTKGAVHWPLCSSQAWEGKSPRDVSMGKQGADPCV